MTDELKPCPCCDNEATLLPHWAGKVRFYVQCDNDGCGLRNNSFGTEHDAITAWNTRKEQDNDME